MDSVRVTAGPMPGSPCCMCMIRKYNHSKMTPKQAQAFTMLNIKIKVRGLVCTFCDDIIANICRFREKVIETQDQLDLILQPMRKKQPTKPAAAPSYAQPLTAPTLAPNPGSSVREQQCFVNVIDKQNETKRNCNVTVQSLNENAPNKNEINQNKNISGSRNKTERHSVETEPILEEDEVKIKIEPDLEDSLLIPTYYVSLKHPETNLIENTIHIEPPIKVEQIDEVIVNERNETQSHVHNTKVQIAEIKIKKMDAVFDDEPVEKQRNVTNIIGPGVAEIKDKTINAVIEIDGTKNINKISSPEDIHNLRITNMTTFEDLLNQLIVDGPRSNKDKMDAVIAIESHPLSDKEQRSDVDDWCTRKVMTLEEVKEKLEEIRNSEEFKSMANRCDPCVRKFTSTQQCDRHVRRFHNPSLRHVCGACSARFAAAADCERHYSAAHHYLHKCKLCSYETMHYSYFLKHYKTWHISGKKPAICPLCKRRVPETRLDAHLKVQHGVGAKEEGGYCPECDVTFKTEALYQLHLKNSAKHNSVDNMAFECHDCGKKAPSKGSIRAHIRVVHLQLKPFTCNICQESFKLKSKLRTHQVSKHEGGLPRKHLCSYCGKAFTQPQSLKDHINTHTGERPYKCDMCSDTFRFSAALFTHRRLKHLGYKWTYGKSKSKKKVVRVEPPSKKAKKSKNETEPKKSIDHNGPSGSADQEPCGSVDQNEPNGSVNSSEPSESMDYNEPSRSIDFALPSEWMD